MKARLLMLAVLAFAPLAAYAHDDAHQGMMPGMMHGMAHAKAEDGHSGDGGHAQAMGAPGDPKKVSRTILVHMSGDMKFTPAKVIVKRGQTIKFVVRNAGQVKHEMVIGSMTELQQHAEMKRKMPGMEHAEPNQVTLDPGQAGDLVWQFTKAGAADFACLLPGHFEAGMKGEVLVE